MKLSTRIMYGTRAMADLASHFGEGPIKIHDISERQDISKFYLQQILSALCKAHLAVSMAGSHGGFALAIEPTKINLLHIVEALEGEVCLAPCVDAPDQCKRSEKCCTRTIWRDIGDQIKTSLKNVTLADLVERERIANSTPLAAEA